ncbi:hypothetical protein RRG08_046214 [Elysia crispata]|uniref:C-type lectin domain-containing protein n=1 Tax=Elysia crispata TaxID=231223 RepID=A0AAE1D285_9GAST|nr:hypothetical protein RRG08_046214 [Elysia crispata]
MEQNHDTDQSFDTMKFLFLFFLPLNVLANETCHLSPITPVCPAGFDLLQNPSQCVHYTFQAFNWSEGRAYCQKADADLLILRSYEMARSVYYYLQRKQETFYWLALNDIDNEGQWVWDIPLSHFGNVTNQTKIDVVDGPYHYFRKGHPIRNNPRRERDHDCSVIEPESSQFVDTHCSLRYKTMCQLHVQPEDIAATCSLHLSQSPTFLVHSSADRTNLGSNTTVDHSSADVTTPRSHPSSQSPTTVEHSSADVATPRSHPSSQSPTTVAHSSADVATPRSHPSSQSPTTVEHSSADVATPCSHPSSQSPTTVEHSSADVASLGLNSKVQSYSSVVHNSADVATPG